MRSPLPLPFLAALAVVALCSPAFADVKLGEVHPVADSSQLDLDGRHVEATGPGGERIVYRTLDGVGPNYEDVLVRQRHATDGTGIADSQTLLTGVDYWGVAMDLDEENKLRASWFNRDNCTAGLATFDADGRRKRLASHAVDPAYCGDGYTYVIRGVAGDSYLYQDLDDPEPDREAFRIIPFDWNGVGPAREIVLEGEANLYFPRIAIGPDGSIATIWGTGGHLDTFYAQVWDADGHAISGPIELDQGYLDRNPQERILALGAGRFLAAWQGGLDGREWIGREIVVGPGQPTTTTTTTTLPPSLVPAMPHVVKLFEAEDWWWSERDPGLTTDGEGTWVASWGRWVSGLDIGAFLSVSHNNGRTWSGAHLLGEGADVAVASDENGDWLAAASDCAGRLQAETCLWRFWRSRDGARTWTGDVGADGSVWTDVLPRPLFGMVGYLAPRLLSEGDGRWVLTLAAERRIDRYGGVDTVVLAARSEDDGVTWSWTPGTLAELPESYSLLPAAVAVTDGSLVLWKLGSFGGIASGSPAALARQALTTWSEPGYFALYPRGFAASSDREQTVIAAWSGRSVTNDGWGWDPDVVFSRSGDAGKTWSEPQAIASQAATDGSHDELPVLATDRRGGWLAAWRSSNPLTHVSDPLGGVLASYSDDDGVSWSPATALAPQEMAPADEYRLDALVGEPRGSGGRWAALWRTRVDDTNSSLWVQMSRPAGRCGDGNGSRDEQCDDGNAIDGDGCDSNCTFTACGNGIPTAGEICDDGNLWPEDACSPRCVPTWCGDGVRRWDTEYCDDGNDILTDDCQPDCTPSNCGDGHVRDGIEQCDDGNWIDDDGCDSDCTLSGCGNGIVTGTEECDDGNEDNDDDCLTSCRWAVCGDGSINLTPVCPYDDCPQPFPTEECDDGNTVDSDACLADCTLPVCGNGIVHQGVEGCDDGNQTEGDGCDANCTPTGCGNGRRTQGEICDDGNTAGGDYCAADCRSFADGCGDADASGEVTVVDAQRVLSSAVGLPVSCPRWACDANGSGKVTAVDGSMVLRKSVGLQVTTICQDRIVVRMTSASFIGALQIRVDHTQAAGTFYETVDEVRCKQLIPALAAYSDHNGFLVLGFISLDGIQGPIDLAECMFRRFAPHRPGEFSVHIENATTLDFGVPQVPPKVALIVD